MSKDPEAPYPECCEEECETVCEGTLAPSRRSFLWTVASAAVPLALAARRGEAQCCDPCGTSCQTTCEIYCETTCELACQLACEVEGQGGGGCDDECEMYCQGMDEGYCDVNCQENYEWS